MREDGINSEENFTQSKEIEKKRQVNFQAFGVHPEGSFGCSPSQGMHR